MRRPGRNIGWLPAIVVALTLCSLSPDIGSAQTALSSGATVEHAQKALTTYVASFLTDKNVDRYGFKNLEEARSAKVGEPLSVMLVSLHGLKGYQRGEKASTVLTNVKTLWFPVLVGDETRAKLELIEKDGILVGSEFGMAKTAEKISAVRKTVPKLMEGGSAGALKNTTIVKVPALAAEFLFVETDQGEYLVPAMINPERLNLEEGKLYPADDLLSRLHDIAKDIDPKKVM